MDSGARRFRRIRCSFRSRHRADRESDFALKHSVVLFGDYRRPERSEGALRHLTVHPHPSPRGGGALDCIQNSMHSQRIFKIRMKRFLPGDRIKKVSQRGDKGMLVSQNMPRLPENFPVWMVHPGDAYSAPALQLRRLSGVEEVQAVHIVESKTQHTLRPIDFKSIAILAAHAITSRLERSYAPIRKPGN